MPRLLSRFIATPKAKARTRRIVLVLFVALALLSWWAVYTEGASPARVLTAVATTAVAAVEAFLPKRRRLLRRKVRAPQSTEDEGPDQVR